MSENSSNSFAMNDRAASGIKGLDRLLGGGFMRNRLYLVQGEPGTGKTTLGLQFALSGVPAGERVLYITMAETSQEITEVASSHGWSLDGIEVRYLSDDERLLTEPQSMLHSAEVDLPETTMILMEQVEQIKPDRVVLDSLSELRVLAQDERWYRRQILALKSYFAQRAITVLLLDDRSHTSADLHLRSIASGVLELEQVTSEFGPGRRRLNIVKMRGLSYDSGYHDYKIRSGGLAVYPRLIAAAHRRQFAADRIKSGLAELDALLGGGPVQGGSLLLLGPSGCGKSLIATQFVLAAAQRGESVAMYIFDERVQTLLQRSKGMGLALEPYIEQGLIHITPVDPGEMTPSEFSHKVRLAVENYQVSLVVIDSLTGYLNAMPGERYLVLHLHELLFYLGEQGVTTLPIVIQQGILGQQMNTPVEVSYLADSVLMFRHFEYSGEMRQALSVYKHRTGQHEHTIRELHLAPGKLMIGEPLKNFHGVMSGMPRYMGPTNQLDEML